MDCTTNSPSDGQAPVEDVHQSDVTPHFYLSNGFNSSHSAEEEEDPVEELVANGSDDEQAGPAANSTPVVNRSFGPVLMTVQPANSSPTQVMRALKMRQSPHNFLAVSGRSTPDLRQASSLCSTPEWRQEDDQEKMDELSSRLEDLKVDLDSSETHGMKLKKENTALRHRLHEYEDRLREAQWTIKDTAKQGKEELRAAVGRLKREHEKQMDELREQLKHTQDDYDQLEASYSLLQAQHSSLKEQCARQDERMVVMDTRHADLEEELRRAREELRAERDKWNFERRSNEQELNDCRHLLSTLKKDLEDTRTHRKKQKITKADLTAAEIAHLKQEVKSLKEENDLLSSKLVHQGQQLMTQQPLSLAEEMAQAPREEVVKALRDQEDYNARLKAYLDSLLTTIIEKHPELLEVKR